MHPRRYETLMLISPNLSPEERESFKGKVDGIIAQGKGQVVRFEDWGRRRLSYPVRKEMYGCYLLYDFQGLPSLAAELERNLKIDERVSKYLTLVLSKKFTDEDLAAAKARLAEEAVKREEERARALEERETESRSDARDDDEGDSIEDQESDDDSEGRA